MKYRYACKHTHTDLTALNSTLPPAVKGLQLNTTAALILTLEFTHNNTYSKES